MRWITRERPKIDRVACPWLIARFIDQTPEFLFVPAAEVVWRAEQYQAVPFDVEGVDLSHDGPLCSFDAFLRKYQLTDPALARLASIVRSADTDTLELSPQAAGLLAISLGLSRCYADDHEMLARGFIIYDALYAWLTQASDEKHNWNPRRQPAVAGGYRI